MRRLDGRADARRLALRLQEGQIEFRRGHGLGARLRPHGYTGTATPSSNQPTEKPACRIKTQVHGEPRASGRCAIVKTRSGSPNVVPLRAARPQQCHVAGHTHDEQRYRSRRHNRHRSTNAEAARATVGQNSAPRMWTYRVVGGDEVPCAVEVERPEDGRGPLPREQARDALRQGERMQRRLGVRCVDGDAARVGLGVEGAAGGDERRDVGDRVADACPSPRRSMCSAWSRSREPGGSTVTKGTSTRSPVRGAPTARASASTSGGNAVGTWASRRMASNPSWSAAAGTTLIGRCAIRGNLAQLDVQASAVGIIGTCPVCCCSSRDRGAHRRTGSRAVAEDVLAHHRRGVALRSGTTVYVHPDARDALSEGDASQIASSIQRSGGRTFVAVLPAVPAAGTSPSGSASRPGSTAPTSPTSTAHGALRAPTSVRARRRSSSPDASRGRAGDAAGTLGAFVSSVADARPGR